MNEKETGSAAVKTAPDKENKNNRRSSERVRRVLAVVITLLLMAAAVLVFIYRDKLTEDNIRGLFGDGKNVPVAGGDAFTYEIGTGQVFAPAGGGLAVASSTAIELLDAAGKTVFKQLVSFGTPAVFASADKALFCDLGGRGCVLAGMDGESVTLQSEGDLITASMNESGWVAVVTDAVGYKGLVSVFDAAGAPKYQWWSGAGYVLKAAVSPDNRLLAVLCSENGGGKLHFFRLEAEEEQAAAAFGGELPFDLCFLGNDRVCAVSSDALTFLDTGGTVKSRFELGEQYLQDYDLGSGQFVTVCVGTYRSGGGGTLQTLDRDGKTLGSRTLDRDLVCLSGSGRQVLAMTSGAVTVYGQDLVPQHSREGLITAKKAVLCSDRSYLLLSSFSGEKVGI